VILGFTRIQIYKNTIKKYNVPEKKHKISHLVDFENFNFLMIFSIFFPILENVSTNAETWRYKQFFVRKKKKISHRSILN